MYSYIRNHITSSIRFHSFPYLLDMPVDFMLAEPTVDVAILTDDRHPTPVAPADETVLCAHYLLCNFLGYCKALCTDSLR